VLVGGEAQAIAGSRLRFGRRLHPCHPLLDAAHAFNACGDGAGLPRRENLNPPPGRSPHGPHAPRVLFSLRQQHPLDAVRVSAPACSRPASSWPRLLPPLCPNGGATQCAQRSPTAAGRNLGLQIVHHASPVPRQPTWARSWPDVSHVSKFLAGADLRSERELYTRRTRNLRGEADASVGKSAPNIMSDNESLSDVIKQAARLQCLRNLSVTPATDDEGRGPFGCRPLGHVYALDDESQWPSTIAMRLHLAVMSRRPVGSGWRSSSGRLHSYPSVSVRD
jgi:hypothetical protein